MCVLLLCGSGLELELVVLLDCQAIKWFSRTISLAVRIEVERRDADAAGVDCFVSHKLMLARYTLLSTVTHLTYTADV